MEGSAIAPPHQVAQWRYMIAALILGGAGSMVAIAAFGFHDYRVGPLVVEMKLKPSTSGTTELAVQAVNLRGGVAEAETHMGFLTFVGTVKAVVGDANLPDAVLAVKDPHSLATTIRDDGEDAIRSFLLRISWITAAGGAAGGAVIALFGMKARRVFQGMAAGIVLVGVLGLVAWQTYDIEKFSPVQFRTAGSAAPFQGT